MHQMASSAPHSTRRHALVTLALLGLVAATPACSDGSSTSAVGSGGVNGPLAVGAVAPDFTLTDVNPSSPTFGEPVSPRDYLESVSGWYFGHAT